MLYEIAHFLRDKMTWLWDMVEVLNSFLFTIRYGRRLRSISGEGVIIKGLPSKFKIVPIREIPTEQLVEFFARQPEEAYRFFKPHGLDVKSIKKLQRNKAFLAYVLLDGQRISGYCFNRSFFHGKGFRGRMVDIDYRGMGLGTMMNKILNEVGFGIGLRLFETVNKDNIASYRSAMSASNVRILEELEGKDLYLEILKV
ncbi:transcriptional regulator [Bacteroides thetaiotaomicron]|uniref:transcriptional regulator n=1 Tax=Bacteroides thetaiotaomicron TaxID=818 RepID=UPI001F3997D1|nr:transcriptional regulator [Bacteroides thetaiotaomicron]MCE8781010.1 transcriptional regulator [Bacteroides thetaiotaomicron]MCS2715192.1 transcriptional regulator [Bacteroides thetaiotaomicron]MCS2875489.1 transcriptional regulator [Bacteroides thetaiotaomicron]